MKAVVKITAKPERRVRLVAHDLVKDLRSSRIVDFIAAGIDSRGNVRVYAGGNSSFTTTFGAVELLRDHLQRDFHGEVPIVPPAG